MGQDLAGGGRADRREDAGADDRADRQHDQVAGADHPLQPGPLRVLDIERRDRLALKQLGHMPRDLYSVRADCGCAHQIGRVSRYAVIVRYDTTTHAAARVERDADQAGPAQHQLRRAPDRRQAIQPARAGQRFDDEQRRRRVERQPLRPAEAAA